MSKTNSNRFYRLDLDNVTSGSDQCKPVLTQESNKFTIRVPDNAHYGTAVFSRPINLTVTLNIEGR